MSTREIPPEHVQSQLERVLASPGFSRNERMSRFLRFVVEKQIAGQSAELKESIIGIEVFGRKPGFDPQRDSTVRTEASRLRARLAEYYAGEGKSDTVIIELRRGGYGPRFLSTEPSLSNVPSGPVAPSRIYRTSWLAAVATVVLAAGSWWTWIRWSVPIPIAVLPFTNVSEVSGNDYLADGLTDEVIRGLSVIDGLAVRSQTSSFALKGKPRNIREAGHQLTAEYILEGSVLRDGQRVRINAQLVRVRDDFPVWSGRYDEELPDVLTIEDEISRNIVNNLRVKLGRGSRKRETKYQANTEAYDLYLRARAAQNWLFPGDAAVIQLFAKVIAKDPSFAPPYAGIAAAYAWRSAESAHGIDREAALHEMRPAAERALELDPLLAEAHSALGMTYARTGDWKLAEKSFHRALELAPNAAFVHESFAWFVLFPLGRTTDAIREMQIAENNDPLSPTLHYEFASVLLAASRLADAEKQCEAMPIDAFFARECLGRVRVAQGRAAEAIPILLSSATRNWGYRAHAYARAGRRAEAGKLLAEAGALYPDRSGSFQYALAYAGLGDKDKTIERLDRISGVGPVRMGGNLNSPEFALLRGDPRAEELRKKVGLPQ